MIADQSALFTRGGLTTDAARDKATKMANAALSDGQLNTYFDSVENEIKAQRKAGKTAMSAFTRKSPDSSPDQDGGSAPKTIHFNDLPE